MFEEVLILLNGVERRFIVGDGEGLVRASETLLETLRERAGLTGSKKSCDRGACGCCTVIMDGDPVASCMVLTSDCHGREVTTIEGLADPMSGQLDPIQQAFIEKTAFQCGYCTPGIIMSCKAILTKYQNPTEDDIREGLAGNYCRCISHYQVMEAVDYYLRQRKEAFHG